MSFQNRYLGLNFNVENSIFYSHAITELVQNPDHFDFSDNKNINSRAPFNGMRGKRFFSEDDSVDFNRVNYFSIYLYNTQLTRRR